MKILIVSNLYPSSPNPADQTGVMLLHQYAKSWRQNHTICVINPNSYNLLTARKLRRERLPQTFELDEIKVFNVPILRLPGDRLLVRKFDKIFSGLGKFDLIIGCLPVGLEISHYLGRKHNVPFFAYLHNTDFHRSGVSKGKITSKYMRFLRRAAGLMYVSHRIKRSFENALPFEAESMLLPGVLEQKWFANLENVINQKASDIVFITAARLVKQKRIDVLLRTLERIQGQNFRYIIAGDGPERNTLEAIVQKSKVLKGRVSFKGMVDQTELMQLYDRSSFMLLISTNESFGLVYLEAMARGCIPVGTKGEGIDGVIINGTNGFLVDPDSESIKNLLETIIEMKPEALIEMSKLARETAENFMCDKVADEFISFAKTKASIV